MTTRIQLPVSESFLRGQRDGRLLAEDFPEQTEAELLREAQIQLRLLSSMGIPIEMPDEYVQGLFNGYQFL